MKNLIVLFLFYVIPINSIHAQFSATVQPKFVYAIGSDLIDLVTIGSGANLQLSYRLSERILVGIEYSTVFLWYGNLIDENYNMVNISPCVDYFFWYNQKYSTYLTLSYGYYHFYFDYPAFGQQYHNKYFGLSPGAGYLMSFDRLKNFYLKAQLSADISFTDKSFHYLSFDIGMSYVF